MLRRLLTYHLAGLVLLTNIGVPVFTHICLGHGTTWTSAFVPVHRDCRAEDGAESNAVCGKEKPCCSDSGKSEPCCDNKISFEQLDLDFLTVSVEETSLTEVTPPVLSQDSRELGSAFSTLISFQPHAPPLPAQGTRVSLLHGVIRC